MVTDYSKVLSRPAARALYEGEARHRAAHGTPSPYPGGGRDHASRQVLGGQVRRGFGAKRRSFR